eukprot:SAG31_NODE_65_length_28565_cov_8.402914_11_plen_50_part_00
MALVGRAALLLLQLALPPCLAQTPASSEMAVGRLSLSLAADQVRSPCAQ